MRDGVDAIKFASDSNDVFRSWIEELGRTFCA